MLCHFLIRLTCLWVLGHIVVERFLDMVHVACIVHQDDFFQELLRGTGGSDYNDMTKR